MVGQCVGLFRGALVALTISAASLFAIPLVQNPPLLPFVLAGIFWVSLLAELLLLVLGNRERKNLNQSSRHMKQIGRFRQIGAFCFFQNREAAIVDVLLPIMVVLAISAGLYSPENQWLITAGITAAYVLLHLHCILNGMLYKTIKYHQTATQKGEIKHE